MTLFSLSRGGANAAQSDHCIHPVSSFPSMLSTCGRLPISGGYPPTAGKMVFYFSPERGEKPSFTDFLLVPLPRRPAGAGPPPPNKAHQPGPRAVSRGPGRLFFINATRVIFIIMDAGGGFRKTPAAARRRAPGERRGPSRAAEGFCAVGRGNGRPPREPLPFLLFAYHCQGAGIMQLFYGVLSIHGDEIQPG